MHTITIENTELSVRIKLTGAELCSLKDKRDGIEHLWQADPKYWPRHAPILFPAVGESKDGKITVDGQDYPMGRHGFLRNLDFEIVHQETDSVKLRLTSGPETNKHYPFDFELTIGYTLEGSQLVQSHHVKNIGTETMGFQVGGHPAFAVPFHAGEAYSDYEILFDRPVALERHLLANNGLYSGDTRTFLSNESSFALRYDLFNEDALVFKNIPSKKVWIQKQDGGKRLLVEYDDFVHLGIWSVPGADYVCLEPWIGCADSVDQPDDFWTKDSLIRLESGQEFSAAFSISLV